MATEEEKLLGFFKKIVIAVSVMLVICLLWTLILQCVMLTKDPTGYYLVWSLNFASVFAGGGVAAAALAASGMLTTNAATVVTILSLLDVLLVLAAVAAEFAYLIADDDLRYVDGGSAFFLSYVGSLAFLSVELPLLIVLIIATRYIMHISLNGQQQETSTRVPADMSATLEAQTQQQQLQQRQEQQQQELEQQQAHQLQQLVSQQRRQQQQLLERQRQQQQRFQGTQASGQPVQNTHRPSNTFPNLEAQQVTGLGRTRVPEETGSGAAEAGDFRFGGGRVIAGIVSGEMPEPQNEKVKKVKRFVNVLGAARSLAETVQENME